MNWKRIGYTLVGMFAGLLIGVFILGSTAPQNVLLATSIGFVVGIGLAALAERRAMRMIGSEEPHESE